MATDGSTAKPLGPTGQYLLCPNGSPDASEVVASRRLRPGLWDLARINTATKASTDLTAPGPIRMVPCAGYLASQSLLVIQPDPTTRNPHLYRGGHRRDGLATLHCHRGCSPGIAQASPDGRKVLIDVECDDAYRDGLWVTPAAGGTPHHVIMGRVGGPSWTPDGKQLLFGDIPLGQPTDQPALWVATADGSTARRLSGLPGNWNSWPVAAPRG